MFENNMFYLFLCLYFYFTCPECSRVCSNNGQLDNVLCTCTCVSPWKGPTCTGKFVQMTSFTNKVSECHVEMVWRSCQHMLKAIPSNPATCRTSSPRMYKPAHFSPLHNISSLTIRTKSLGSRTFSKCCLQLWSSLPSYIHFPQSIEQFKIQLKSHFFFIAYC